MPQSDQNYDISLFDASGKKIYELKDGYNFKTLIDKPIEGGVYFIRISNGESVWLDQFVR